MSKKKTAPKAPVTQEVIDRALASTVTCGDIVNFRGLFAPVSPLRADSPEDIHSGKYCYFFTADQNDPRYREALALAQTPTVRDWVRKQLEKKGPAQLPSQLLLALADNAVRLSKFTLAAQAYELLRIRRRMQTLYFDQADAALDARDYARAVHGYWIGAGLSYDYAAFPEPMPRGQNYQSRALVLHARYPTRPEEHVALQPPELHLRIALGYLLVDPDAVTRITARAPEEQLNFFEHLVKTIDPQWSQFTERYRKVCNNLQQSETLPPQQQDPNAVGESVGRDESLAKLKAIPAELLGREIPNGEWWQYVKELAFQHPASILFLGRHVIDRSNEIVKPFILRDSPVVKRLQLLPL
ncbi:MAG: hypothetical protein HYV27_17730 [Candidatus Hydrogenedentes bacterium]|nr:hypothetical protein [Candidatus Hydrogenedentota bacterium]